MHAHILGVSGTFMSGIALLASKLGYEVSGSDLAYYPPMSIQLENLKIPLHIGYDSLPLIEKKPDHVIVGNVMTRGMEAVEYTLKERLPYFSGPEWLSRFVLPNRHVLAVSGTHGKTTTASLLAWILEFAGLNPGFLIGGIPNNFDVSARLGTGPYFVVEADEYDSAFFDKRSKFVHYQPQSLIINNIEFDHADIFPDLKAIQTQFHHLVRLVPGNGLIIHADADPNIHTVLKRGCWTPTQSFGLNTGDWQAQNLNAPEGFSLLFKQEILGQIQWSLIGEHNVSNALAAIAAAVHVGVAPKMAIAALNKFTGVKRRLELKGELQGVKIWDDFAHHPTAIATTLRSMKEKCILDRGRLITVIDIRSNTMKAGHHKEALPGACKDADRVYFFYGPDTPWSVSNMWGSLHKPGGAFTELDRLLENLILNLVPDDCVVFMSNGALSSSSLLEKMQMDIT